MKTTLWIFVLGLTLMLVGCKRSSAWVETTSAAGRFKASFPAKPFEQSKEIPIGDRKVTLYALTISRKSDGREYDVMWSDYPTDIMALTTPQQVLENIRKGYDDEGKKVLAYSEITVSGHAGREVEIDMGNGTITRLRYFLDGPRLYQIMTITPTASRGDPDLQKFFDSFALVR